MKEDQGQEGPEREETIILLCTASPTPTLMYLFCCPLPRGIGGSCLPRRGCVPSSWSASLCPAAAVAQGTMATRKPRRTLQEVKFNTTSSQPACDNRATDKVAAKSTSKGYRIALPRFGGTRALSMGQAVCVTHFAIHSDCRV